MGLLSSIRLQTGPDPVDLDAATLLSFSLIPILVGTIAAALPATVSMLGRLALVMDYGASAGPSKSTAKKTEQHMDPEAWANKEADDYVNQLIRPR